MKLIDSYIIKKFLTTFIFSIILIISLAIVIDLTEKIEDFIEKAAPLRAIIVDYYFNFIPFYTNLFMFLFVFIAVVFFTSKMAAHSEIIAILSTGVSFRRMMFPYFISALILAIGSFFLSNFIIPHSNKVRLKFEDTYVNGTYYNREVNIHKQLEPGVFIYLENYRVKNNMGSKFSIEKYEGKKLVSKLISRSMQWDTATKKWRVYNYFIRDIVGEKETIRSGKRLDTALTLKPEDFVRRDTDKAKMDYNQLKSFIAEKKLRGETNTAVYMLEEHQRIAFPFSTFILTLMGVALSARKVKGGAGVNVGIGLILSFTYLFFMQMSAQFSIKGNLSPILSAWIPNILFAIIAFYLYKKAPK